MWEITYIRQEYLSQCLNNRFNEKLTKINKYEHKSKINEITREIIILICSKYFKVKLLYIF